MRIAICICVLLCSLGTAGQGFDFPLQEIIDSVPVNRSGQESFSLYMPSAYNSEEPTSIVVIFDPGGRGRVGITPFIQAAEKYNHVLICSNDSRNGPYERNFQIARRLFDKIFSEFNYNKKRIYTAGFSGGARLASTIAIKTQMIEGVIACGAGMSSNDLLFQNEWNFSYAAIVGDRDMNLQEMMTTQNYADKLKVSNELFIYEMGHQWPSKKQVIDAFDWLEIEADRKGIIEQSPSNIKEIYNQILNRAVDFENNNQLIEAAAEYQRLIDNFSRYFPMDVIRSRMKELRQNPDLRKQNEARKKIFEEEKLRSKEFFARFYNDLDKKKKNLKWWESKIDKLKKERQDQENQMVKMFDRLLYSLYALAIENVTIEGVNDVNQALFCYDICILIYPHHYALYFKQIENALELNNEDLAIGYLEKMISEGFQDYEEIETNKIFNPLKSNSRFQELLK